MRNKELVISLFLVIVISGCNGQDMNKKDKSISSQTQQEGWVEDTNGCLKKRTKKVAEKLIDENSLTKKSLNEFYSIFGKPNERKEEDEVTTLTYYFDATCDKGKLLDGGDKCYANYYFKANKLINKEYLCE